MIELNKQKSQYYLCQVCLRQLRSKKILSDHQSIHTGERKQVCGQCHKSFIQYSSLQKHKRIHTGDKPYICIQQDCDKQFNQISNLKRHNLTHLNIKSHLCQECDKMFVTSTNLKQHQKIHLKTEQRKLYICEGEGCQKNYFYSSSLKKHQQSCDHFNKKNSIDQQQQLEAPKSSSKIYFNDISEICEGQKNYFYQSSQKKNQQSCDLLNQQQLSDQPSQFHSYLNDISDYNFIQFDRISHSDQLSIPTTNDIDTNNIQKFFTSKHPKVQHDNHIDILFNGHLYYYNQENGKIECHNYQSVDDSTIIICDPIKLHYKINKHFDQIKCCDQQSSKYDCNFKCISNHDQACCLACNSGQCLNQQENQSNQNKHHSHGPQCGHPIIFHMGHYDYLVDSYLHRPHIDHCDNHGYLRQLELLI